MNVPPRSRGMVRRRAATSAAARQITLPAQRFIHTEAVSGIVLLAAALIGIIWVNSPWSDSYHDLWDTLVTVDIGLFDIEEDLRHWVNDGLMVFFFFVVGMEIKRELVHGELSNRRRAALPIVAALGGMIVPALIFTAFNLGSDGQDGWGIPMATDIAFALGVLALMARGIPSEVRIFLLALAIVDDIGAILVIAVFYTSGLSPQALAIAVGLLALVLLMRQAGVVTLLPYFAVGILFWAAVLESGVHATIAGVILGLLTPAAPWLSKADFLPEAESLEADFRTAMEQGDEDRADQALGEWEELIQATEAPTDRLNRLLLGVTSFAIVPLFAMANAGVELSGGALQDAAASRVAIGVFFGLIVGKFVGIMVFSWLAVKIGIGTLPGRMTWRHVSAIALLAGIGFTVSLFVTGLAFEEEALIADAKIGIFAASLLAGIIGALVIRSISPRAPVANAND